MAPANFFFFPLDYGEKINGPPQHWTAGPPTHFSTILPAQVEGYPGPKKNFLASKIFPKKKKGLGTPEILAPALLVFSSGSPPKTHEPPFPLAHHPASLEQSP